MQINSLSRINYNKSNQTLTSQTKQLSFGSKESLIGKIAKNAQDAYMKSGIKESLLKNSHETIDLSKAEKLVSEIVSKITKDAETSPMHNGMHIANWSDRFAKEFGEKHSAIIDNRSLSQETSEAIIVDFLNFMSKQEGIDLGLHTKDLNKLSQPSFLPRFN